MDIATSVTDVRCTLIALLVALEDASSIMWELAMSVDDADVSAAAADLASMKEKLLSFDERFTRLVA